MLTIKELVDKFDLELVNENKEILKREIKASGFNRAGLELSGFFIKDEARRIIILGNKESQYVDQLDDKTKIERYKSILKDKDIPCLILTKKFLDKENIIKLAKKLNFPVLVTEMGMSDTWQTVGNYVIERLKVYQIIHGTVINIYGIGVLITGESGIGKSEITLELIRRGHLFTGDDAIDIASFSGKLVAKANPRVGNFLEVRGLGILNVKRMFGVELIQTHSQVKMIVELVVQKKGEIFDRLGIDRESQNILGVNIPHYKLPVKAGRNLTDLVEMAVIEYKMRQDGYISAEDFLNHSKEIHELEKENGE